MFSTGVTFCPIFIVMDGKWDILSSQDICKQTPDYSRQTTTGNNCSPLRTLCSSELTMYFVCYFETIRIYCNLYTSYLHVIIKVKIMLFNILLLKWVEKVKLEATNLNKTFLNILVLFITFFKHTLFDKHCCTLDL